MLYIRNSIAKKQRKTNRYSITKKPEKDKHILNSKETRERQTHTQ